MRREGGERKGRARGGGGICEAVLQAPVLGATRVSLLYIGIGTQAGTSSAQDRRVDAGLGSLPSFFSAHSSHALRRRAACVALAEQRAWYLAPSARQSGEGVIPARADGSLPAHPTCRSACSATMHSLCVCARECVPGLAWPTRVEPAARRRRRTPVRPARRGKGKTGKAQLSGSESRVRGLGLVGRCAGLASTRNGSWQITAGRLHAIAAWSCRRFEISSLCQVTPQGLMGRSAGRPQQRASERERERQRDRERKGESTLL